MMPRLHAFIAVLRGGVVALRDPRRLATLGAKSASARAEDFERECLTKLGGLPRCVPLELILDADGDSIAEFTFLDDTSTVLDLLLLRALVRRYDARTMLEIGTFRGESATAVAGAGAHVVTVSLDNETLVQRGAERSWVDTHRILSAGHPRITHVFGDSAVLDTRPYVGWADILFIDGDHSREAVESDTRRFWETRSPRVGAVVWHDAFSSPLVPRWEVLAGITAGVPPSARSQLVQVSNTLCLAWLPDADSLPTVDRSYVPRVVYTVGVKPVLNWKPKEEAEATNSKDPAPFPSEPVESGARAQR